MQALTVLVIFIVAVALMYKKILNTLVGLPLLALSVSVVAGLPLNEILTTVISQGALRLHSPMIIIIFGATLAEIVKRSGMVESLIRNTAEYYGDRLYVITFLLFLITTLLFTVLGGLGAIVMVGSILFPILLSLGISKLGSACIFLLGLSLGGTFNLVNWSLYMEVLGLSQSDVLKYVLCFFPLALLISIVFILVELRRQSGASFLLQISKPSLKKGPGVWNIVTPVIPVFLVM